MPINPQIALGIQPQKAPDLYGDIGHALQLKGLMTQQENLAADRDYKLSELLMKKKLQNLLAGVDPTAKGDAQRLEYLAQFGDHPEQVVGLRGQLQERHDDMIGQTALSLAIAPKDQRAAQYEIMRKDLEDQGISVPEKYPGSDFIDYALAKSKRHAGALEKWQGKRTTEEFWAQRQQALAQQGPQAAGFAPGSEPTVKPMQEGIPYSLDNPPSEISTLPVTVTQKSPGDANNPDILREQAAYAETHGNTALAMKYRAEADRVEKTLTDAGPKDQSVRIMQELQNQPSMPEWQRRAYLDTLGHLAGLPDDFQYEMKDSMLILSPRTQVQEAKNTRAEKSGVRVNVNTGDKVFDTAVGKAAGESFGNDYKAAKAAQESLVTTIEPLKKAIDSGKVILGPGANARLFLLRGGSAIGVTGKNDDEVLASTRQAISGLAKVSIQTAALLKGQGQITEKERQLIEDAASGKIENLSPAELKALVDALYKTARYKIKQHGQNMDRMKNQPGLENVLPMMRIDVPDEPTVGAQWVPSFRSGWRK